MHPNLLPLIALTRADELRRAAESDSRGHLARRHLWGRRDAVAVPTRLG